MADCACFCAWKAIARSRDTRSAIGGWVAKRSPTSPAFWLTRLPSGSAMHRCATPPLIVCVGAPARSILSRA